MSLSIGKSVLYHPRRTFREALGSKIRVTSRMYHFRPNSNNREWITHVIEATLCDISPPPPESANGAFAFISTKAQYIFELCQTYYNSDITEDLIPRYEEAMRRTLAEYEADDRNSATLIAMVREDTSAPPVLYLKTSSSEHIIAEGDTLMISVLGYPMQYVILGDIIDIEIID